MADVLMPTKVTGIRERRKSGTKASGSGGARMARDHFGSLAATFHHGETETRRKHVSLLCFCLGCCCSRYRAVLR